MTATRDEKLRQLRRVVEDAPPERLEMTTFTCRKSCGTAHCAAGHARLDPWFLANTTIDEIFYAARMAPNDGGADAVAYEVHPRRNGNTFRLLGDLFEISKEDSRRLFGADLTFDEDVVEKAEVIANIDRLLAGEPAKYYASLMKNYASIVEDDE